jgi:hypothetical protein
MRHFKFVLLEVVFMASSCQLVPKPNQKKDVSVPTTQNAVYTFGHLDSFIQNPDILFKYDNQTKQVSSTHYQAEIDVTNPPAFEPLTVSTQLTNSLDSLLANIPSAITSNSTHQLGGPFPDVGYSYLQIETVNQKNNWSLLPVQTQEVSPFANQLMKIMNELEKR